MPVGGERPTVCATSKTRRAWSAPNGCWPTWEKERAGRCQLAYLDECGFAPSQPVTYSWVAAKERKRVPYENPERRRYNVIALYAPAGPAPFLDWHGRSIHLTSDELIGLLAVRH